MAKIHSELAKAAKQNAMSVSESALHDYPAYWEFMGDWQTQLLQIFY